MENVSEKKKEAIDAAFPNASREQKALMYEMAGVSKSIGHYRPQFDTEQGTTPKRSISQMQTPATLSAKNAAPDDIGQYGKGNIDLYARPQVKNSDGSVSTVRSMSFNEDGMEILVPTVSMDGRIMSNQEAIDYYHKTGQYLGKFKTVAEAEAYAQKLHEQQAQYYRL